MIMEDMESQATSRHARTLGNWHWSASVHSFHCKFIKEFHSVPGKFVKIVHFFYIYIYFHTCWYLIIRMDFFPQSVDYAWKFFQKEQADKAKASIIVLLVELLERLLLWEFREDTLYRIFCSKSWLRGWHLVGDVTALTLIHWHIGNSSPPSIRGRSGWSKWRKLDLWVYWQLEGKLDSK